MNEKQSKRAKTLAEDHWSYINGIFAHLPESDVEVSQICYHYLTAFEHGYKHAIEDLEDANDKGYSCEDTEKQPKERPYICSFCDTFMKGEVKIRKKDSMTVLWTCPHCDMRHAEVLNL